jgi:uncharacterized membrane protein YbhN (UPF0104 family)
VRRKKLAVGALTLGITAYLVYRVYFEASRIKVTPSQLLSPYLFLAFALGVAGYLTYTAIWYLYLRNITEVEFRRVFLANLSGTYLSFSLNAAVGTLVKVTFIHASYLQVLAASLMEVSTEFLVGFSMVFIFTHSMVALLIVLFFLTAFIADDTLYAVLYRVFTAIGRGQKLAEDFYAGWKAAKSNPKRVLLCMVLGTVLVLLNAGILMSVARIFGIYIPVMKAVKAILYSEFLGSVLGTPGGLGGNELGVLMAIGNSGLNVIIAFIFKFINQYMFALAGALAFYRSVLGRVNQLTNTAEGNSDGDGRGNR